MLQEGGKSHQTLGGGERCRVRDGPRFGEGAEEQELGHPAAPWELLGRFPEPRLTSTGQLDHNSPALLLGTRNTGKLLPNGAKRNRALSPPKTNAVLPKQRASMGSGTACLMSQQGWLCKGAASSGHGSSQACFSSPIFPIHPGLLPVHLPYRCLPFFQKLRGYKRHACYRNRRFTAIH